MKASLIDAAAHVVAGISGGLAIDTRLMGAACRAVLEGLRTATDGGTAAFGGVTIFDFGRTTCFTVPRGDLYFGASQGSGNSRLDPFSGTMML